MAKSSTPSPPHLVPDPRTGRMVEVNGLGGLNAELNLREDIDLTQPIFEQVSKADIPNATTRAAIEDSRAMMKARTTRFSDGEALIVALEQEDR
jgi:hypothetical protein